MSSIASGDDLFFTQSMAEVLEKQGYLEDALVIYKMLADTSPLNETLRQKVQSLKDQAVRGRGRKLS